MKAFAEKIKKDFTDKDSIILFVVCFIGGLFVHGYEMFAKHPNYDEFISIFHYGGGYNLGRWMLSLIGNLIFRIDGLVSLPWFNGLLFITFISLAACLFIIPLEINNRFIRFLIGLIFISFPSMTATLSYMFTAPYYAFAILLVAFAFYIAVDSKYGFIPAAFLICFSMGIYQAYFCLIASFLLAYVIKDSFLEKHDLKKTFCNMGKYLTMMVVGLLSYMIANKIFLKYKNTDLSSYQGISEMGKYSPSSIFNAIGLCYKKFFSFFYEDYVTLFPYKALNIVLIILWIIFIAAFIMVFANNVKKNKKSLLALFELLLVPFAINLIFVMCANSLDTVHALMCESVIMMFVFPLLIIDLFISDKKNKGVNNAFLYTASVVTVFAFLIYAKFANTSYLAYELHYEQTYSFFNELKTRIQSADDYSKDMPVCFVGTYDDDSSLWALKKADSLAGTYQTPYIVNYGEARARLFETYLGYKYDEVSLDESLLSNEEFLNMGNYPDYNSVKVINNTVIVKFSE